MASRAFMWPGGGSGGVGRSGGAGAVASSAGASLSRVPPSPLLLLPPVPRAALVVAEAARRSSSGGDAGGSGGGVSSGGGASSGASGSGGRGRRAASRAETAKPAAAAATAAADPAALLADVEARQAQIRRWAAAYYNGPGEPEVPDAVYDARCEELRALEARLRAPPLSRRARARALLAAAPRRAVGAPVAAPPGAPGGIAKVRHPTPMLSLPAAQDAAGVLEWGRRLERLGVDPTKAAFTVEPKVDGLALRAVYR